MRRIVAFWPQALTAGAVLAAWEIAASTSKPYWLPNLQRIASSWWDLASSNAFRAAGMLRTVDYPARLRADRYFAFLAGITNSTTTLRSKG